MAKYFILILCFALPVLLVAEEVTVPVGGEEATIKVEEGKTATEVKPPDGSGVLVIPEEKLPEYNPQGEPTEVIEDSEEDRGWSIGLKIKWYSTFWMNQPPYWFYCIRTQAWTKRTGAVPHFKDLWFNWRWNWIKFNQLHTGSMVQNYRYDYRNETYPDSIVDGMSLIWDPGLNYRFSVRAASGHMGYDPWTSGDALTKHAMKRDVIAKPDAYVYE